MLSSSHFTLTTLELFTLTVARLSTEEQAFLNTKLIALFSIEICDFASENKKKNYLIFNFLKVFLNKLLIK